VSQWHRQHPADTVFSRSAFLAGGIAACGAVTATHPFETVKIRMQLQGELQDKGHQPHHYRGPIHGVSVIVRHEGLRGIYRGLGCAYIYQVLLNGCRLGFYEPMRSTLTAALFEDDKTQSLGVNMFCGAGSGILGAAAGSPFFLAKTRLQSYSPFRPVGTQHNYRNAWDGLSQIYRGEGVRGLYRGVGAAMIRTGFGSSVQLPTYFFAKRRLVKHLGMEEGAPLHLASSAASGFVVCVVMHPPGRQPPPPFRPSSANPVQTPSCRGYTTKTATSTRAYLTASPKRSRPRASLPSTRAFSRIWRASCRTRS